MVVYIPSHQVGKPELVLLYQQIECRLVTLLHTLNQYNIGFLISHVHDLQAPT